VAEALQQRVFAKRRPFSSGKLHKREICDDEPALVAVES